MGAAVRAARRGPGFSATRRDEGAFRGEEQTRKMEGERSSKDRGVRPPPAPQVVVAPSPSSSPKPRPGGCGCGTFLPAKSLAEGRALLRDWGWGPPPPSRPAPPRTVPVRPRASLRSAARYQMSVRRAQVTRVSKRSVARGSDRSLPSEESRARSEGGYRS